MWYSFMLNGQMEIAMLTLKQIKAGRVEAIIFGKHPQATDIKVATDEEVTAIFERVTRTRPLIQGNLISGFQEFQA